MLTVDETFEEFSRLGRCPHKESYQNQGKEKWRTGLECTHKKKIDIFCSEEKCPRLKQDPTGVTL